MENLAIEFQLTTDDKRAFLKHYRPLEGTLRSRNRIAALTYAKTWLKTHRDDLALEDVGVEINLIAGLSLPLLMAPIAISRWLSGNPVWLAPAIPLGVVCAILAGRRTRTLARYELEDAFRNLALAAWVSEAGAITDATVPVVQQATDVPSDG